MSRDCECTASRAVISGQWSVGRSLEAHIISRRSGGHLSSSTQQTSTTISIPFPIGYPLLDLSDLPLHPKSTNPGNIT
jgi:hypothetical protein